MAGGPGIQSTINQGLISLISTGVSGQTLTICPEAFVNEGMVQADQWGQAVAGLNQFSNADQLSPGIGGSFDITGDFSQTAAGALNIDIGSWPWAEVFASILLRATLENCLQVCRAN